MNEKLTSVKNFVQRNKTRILLTTTVVSTTIAVVEAGGIKSLNEFLKEHNLFDEYYNSDES